MTNGSELPPMHFSRVVDFLQAMIWTEKSRTPEGYRELGWCCSEHALVMALAMRHLGHSVNVSEGEVYIRLPAGWEDVVVHYFVTSDISSIYDTSIKFKDICGISPDMDSNRFKVSLNPSEKKNEIGKLDHGIWYFQKRIFDPGQYTSVVAKTPYGDWLTSVNVEHGKFWKSAALVTAGVLNGNIVIPEPFPDRRVMVENTIRGAYLALWKD